MAVPLKVSKAAEVSEVPEGRPGFYDFSVSEYDRMIESGILTKDDRVELLEGRVVEMSPIGMGHQGAVDFLNEALAPLRDRGILRIQGSMRLGDRSEPQPDLLLLRRRDDYYRSELPGPDDVLLLIEVADSSRSYDRSVKLPLYAEAGIAEVWVVDLVDRVVEVHRQPQNGRYGSHDTFGAGDTVSCDAFPDLGISVAGILGESSTPP